MSIRISFKLKGYEKQMALALQRQMYEEGGPINLDTIVERLFVNWMNKNRLSVDTQTDGQLSEDTDQSPETSENSNEPSHLQHIAPTHEHSQPQGVNSEEYHALVQESTDASGNNTEAPYSDASPSSPQQ